VTAPGDADTTSSTGSRWLVWGTVAAVAVVLVLGVVFADRFGVDNSIAASPLIGKASPDPTLPALDGDGTVRISDHAGDVRVVNFWASWCLSCRVEHPALLAASDQYAGFGVTFVGIDVQDATAAGRAYLDERGWGDNYVHAEDPDSRAAFAFGMLGVPETFFIDRDGIVVGKVSGPISSSLLTTTIDRILLGESVDSVSTGDVENR
jgi:cytochrome c biogenesis protein CcmG/thiol:disulfide interchange protein DsbE